MKLRFDFFVLFVLSILLARLGAYFFLEWRLTKGRTGELVLYNIGSLNQASQLCVVC